MTIRKIRNAESFNRLNSKNVVRILNAAAPADAAVALDRLDIATLIKMLSLLALDKQAAIVAYLPLSRQAEIIEHSAYAAPLALFAALPADEQADLYKRLSEQGQALVMQALNLTQQHSMLELAEYPENSAGAVTTTDFVALHKDATAEQALQEVRNTANKKETVYALYVLDNERHLLGTLSLRELVLMPPGQSVGEAMRAKPVFVHAADPKTEAADKIQHYDLLALPVLDNERRMIGIITVDDAMDVAETADQSGLARFGGSFMDEELDLRTTSLPKLFVSRFFWLALLTVFGVITSSVLAGKTEILDQVIILAAFLPPIIGMGGNTGSQSATLVIRALALGQVRPRLKDFLFVLKRDLPVAFMMGVGIALLQCLLAYASRGVSREIVFTVGAAMFTVTMAGSFLGLLLPFAARKLGIDPATLSAPLITSAMDILGVLIYFAFASVFLASLLS